MRFPVVLVVLLVTGIVAWPLRAQEEPGSARRADTLHARVGVVPAGGGSLGEKATLSQADTSVSLVGGSAEGGPFHPLRFYGGIGTLAVADAAVMVGLSSLWYGEDRVRWHWYKPAPEFDDGWLDDWHTYVQQDKLGHVFVAWQLARVFGAYGRWSGLSDKQAGLFGGAVSAIFQTQIEIFDGFDPAYGASRTDVAANIVGGVIGGLKVAYPDKLDWFESRYSYHPSPYYDKSVSGNAVLRYAGNAIKDYNGISYWLVVKPERLLPAARNAHWPDWLGVSLGYSGTGLAHPISGLSEPQNAGLPSEHHRQFFLSLDLDLIERIPVPGYLKGVQTFFSFVRIPAPALELGGAGTRWHWLYY